MFALALENRRITRIKDGNPNVGAQTRLN